MPTTGRHLSTNPPSQGHRRPAVHEAGDRGGSPLGEREAGQGQGEDKDNLPQTIMNHLRDLDFWLKAGPTLAALIVPLLTYLWLARRIEGYKNDLSKALETHKSQLQSAFQLRFFQFQTRYTWLQQRRAEAIEKLYAMLAKVEGDLTIWVTPTHELRNQMEDEHYRTTEEHFQEMINFFDERRIYFDQEISVAVLRVVEVARVIYDQYPDVERASGPVPDLAMALKQNAAQLKEQNIGPLMALLEDRFRKLLKAEAPDYQLDRTSSPDGGFDRKQ
jgi:hypothetical protein